jgi:hypothetical protein
MEGDLKRTFVSLRGLTFTFPAYLCGGYIIHTHTTVATVMNTTGSIS